MPASANPNYLRMLNRDVRAVLFVDVVDSVGMIERDEEATVGRWVDFVAAVTIDVLPGHRGRMVKSLGDGFLVDFASTRLAVDCALAVQRLARQWNERLPDADHIRLRMGIDVGSIIVGEHDVYGHSVNLAARLMTTLAGPGQIAMSADARDLVTQGLDADIEDLGECYLKSIKTPVRAYRVGPPGTGAGLVPDVPKGRLLPTLAIIPFAGRLALPEHDVLGDMLADDVNRALSRSQNVDVISRLSTMAFRDRMASIAEIGVHLKASYVLSGTYRTDATTIVLDLELSEVRSGRVIWGDRFQDHISGLFAGDQDLVGRVASDVYSGLATAELKRARTQPLATLESYTLLLSAIILMHRRSARDFLMAREMLEAVIDREPRHAVPKAWLANWYVLRIQQGMSEDVPRDRSEAVRCTSTALEADPDSSLALAINGLVHTHMTMRHDLAEENYRLATESNPNEALAWLLKGTHHAFTGNGEQAVKDTQRALKLSPMDPQAYYYHSLSASAFISAGDSARAVLHADAALRSNRLHTSSLRTKAVAQWWLGQEELARQTCSELMRLEPNLRVSVWLKRSPSAGYAIGQEFAKTMEAMGVPV